MKIKIDTKTYIHVPQKHMIGRYTYLWQYRSVNFNSLSCQLAIIVWNSLLIFNGQRTQLAQSQSKYSIL